MKSHVRPSSRFKLETNCSPTGRAHACLNVVAWRHWKGEFNCSFVVGGRLLLRSSQRLPAQRTKMRFRNAAQADICIRREVAGRCHIGGVLKEMAVCARHWLRVRGQRMFLFVATCDRTSQSRQRFPPHEGPESSVCRDGGVPESSATAVTGDGYPRRGLSVVTGGAHHRCERRWSGPRAAPRRTLSVRTFRHCQTLARSCGERGFFALPLCAPAGAICASNGQEDCDGGRRGLKRQLTLQANARAGRYGLYACMLPPAARAQPRKNPRTAIQGYRSGTPEGWSRSHTNSGAATRFAAPSWAVRASTRLNPV